MPQPGDQTSTAAPLRRDDYAASQSAAPELARTLDRFAWAASARRTALKRSRLRVLFGCCCALSTATIPISLSRLHHNAERVLELLRGRR